MERLMLRPDAESYNQEEGSEVIGVQLDGGAGRYRRDKEGAARMISATWTMNPQQFAYWRAFWHLTMKKGLPFLCDLVGEDGLGPQQHVCRVVPGSVSMPMQMGLTYTQSATLEVKPNPVDEEALGALIAMYGLGADTDVFWDLDRLVNETAPEALPPA